MRAVSDGVRTSGVTRPTATAPTGGPMFGLITAARGAMLMLGPRIMFCAWTAVIPNSAVAPNVSATRRAVTRQFAPSWGMGTSDLTGRRKRLLRRHREIDDLL